MATLRTLLTGAAEGKKTMVNETTPAQTPPTEAAEDEKHEGIWLEVTEVRYDSERNGTCSLLLKGDREYPKPVWWPVEDKALTANAFETYKEILREMDKKRLVLARLSRNRADKNRLSCDAFRFQSPDLGSR